MQNRCSDSKHQQCQDNAAENEAGKVDIRLCSRPSDSRPLTLSNAFSSTRSFRLASLIPQRILPWTLALVQYTNAQDGANSTGPCNFDLGNTHPGGGFAFNAWLSNGQCIRDVGGNFTMCRDRLLDVLSNNIDALHQAEYSSSASTLALLPTIGALFGSPTSEVWALLKMYPPAASLALCLSFGGSVLPTHCDDYIKVLRRQGMQAYRRKQTGFEHHADESDKIVAQNAREALALHQRLDQAMGVRSDDMSQEHEDPHKNRLHQILGTRTADVVLFLGCLGLFTLLAGVMSGMAIVEQGAIYTTWCTSTWWMHVWYLVVTFCTVFDCWIQLPFNERWKVYITQHETSAMHLNDATSDKQSNDLTVLSTAVENHKDIRTVLAQLRSRSTTRVESFKSYSSKIIKSRTSMVAISVSTEDKRSPAWVVLLRLFSKAVGLTIYVFATSVFAAVALLALPMAQMVLILVMGAGVFSRAIVTGLVTTIAEEKGPLIHIIADSNTIADKTLQEVLAYRGQDRSKWYAFEFDGDVWAAGRFVKKRNRWLRVFFGIFARPVHFPDGFVPGASTHGVPTMTGSDMLLTPNVHEA